jgi:hypothetical protein
MASSSGSAECAFSAAWSCLRLASIFGPEGALFDAAFTVFNFSAALVRGVMDLSFQGHDGKMNWKD